MNTGPTDILSYDPKTGAFSREFPCDEEMVERYRALDGRLAIPGMDATESWEWGNLYVKEAAGWTKHRTLPKAVHVLDLASHDGAWYAATATSPDERSGIGTTGEVFRSDDAGKGWRSVLRVDAPRPLHTRVQHLVPFQGRLYAFPYSYGGIHAKNLPQALRPTASLPDSVMTFYQSPFQGSADTAVLEKGAWERRKLFPEPLAYPLHAAVFGDRLLVNGLFGDRVYEGVPASGKPALYAFDGSDAAAVPAPLDRIIDMETCADRLVCLGTSGGRWHVASTTDLADWDLRALPPFLTPLSVWREGDRTYVGAADGSLYVDEALPEAEAARHAASPLPRRTTVGGWVPGQGCGPWTAVIAWQVWGKTARLDAAVAPGNRIEASSENVAACSFFFPHPFLEDGQPVTVRLDGAEAYHGPVQGGELRLARGDGGAWTASWNAGGREAWRLIPKIFFRLDRPVGLDPAGESPLADWVADAFREAAQADVALVNNGDLRKAVLAGDVSLRDLWDLHHPGDLLVFEASGRNLTGMLRANQAAWNQTRCRISGFTMTCRPIPGKDSRELVGTSLDPGRRYRVAVQGYLVRHAERFFGRTVEASPAGVSSFEALARKASLGAPSPEPDGRIRLSGEAK